MNNAAVAEIGALLGDPARVSMMSALLSGRALTAGELAEVARVTPQTASTHLAKLQTAGLITMERQGRHRYHRLASSQVAELLELMHVATTPRPSRRIDPTLRLARSCYDHLAGRLGIAIAQSVTVTAMALPGSFDLSPCGADRLTHLGLDLPSLRKTKRPFCRACLDWTERRPHIAGTLGGAILDHLLALHWVERIPGSRGLSITPKGVTGLDRTFEIRTHSLSQEP